MNLLLRRMLLFLAILMVVTALTSGLAPPPPRTAEKAEPSPEPARTTGPPAVVERTIAASRKRPATVEVEQGDILRLTVTAGDGTDAVELQGLAGLTALVPGTPVVFDVLADRPGDYPVALLEAGRSIATVRITPPER